MLCILGHKNESELGECQVVLLNGACRRIATATNIPLRGSAPAKINRCGRFERGACHGCARSVRSSRI